PGCRRERVEEPDRYRKKDEIDKRCPQHEEDRSGDEVGAEGIALMAVKSRRDEAVDLDGDQRKAHEKRAEEGDLELDDEHPQEMRRNQRHILVGAPFER